jgi:hypothetical protein
VLSSILIGGKILGLRGDDEEEMDVNATSHFSENFPASNYILFFASNLRRNLRRP